MKIFMRYRSQKQCCNCKGTVMAFKVDATPRSWVAALPEVAWKLPAWILLIWQLCSNVVRPEQHPTVEILNLSFPLHHCLLWIIPSPTYLVNVTLNGLSVSCESCPASSLDQGCKVVEHGELICLTKFGQFCASQLNKNGEHYIFETGICTAGMDGRGRVLCKEFFDCPKQSISTEKTAMGLYIPSWANRIDAGCLERELWSRELDFQRLIN